MSKQLLYIIGDNGEMLRDENLIPLSHQHQHALALCVRIDRAPAGMLAEFQPEIAEIWENEIQYHFAAEEQVLFPAARRFTEMQYLVSELLNEHEQLRRQFVAAQQNLLESSDIIRLATALGSHVRKEERRLFQDCQRLLSTTELARLGAEMSSILARSPGQRCSIPPRST